MLNHRIFCFRILRSVGNSLFCLLALIGGIHLLAAILGDELVTPFRPLSSFRSDLLPVRDQVLTTTLKPTDSAEKHWQALQTTRELLQAINPDILNWLNRLHRERRIIWEPRPTLFNWPVLASYDVRFDNFYLGPDFWKMPEGEKVAIIAHEYFHARQNKIRMFADTIDEALSGKLSDYGSRTEDEAHLYQLFAYRALGMPTSEIVRGYFNHRQLYRFALSESGYPDGPPVKPFTENSQAAQKR